MHRLRELADRIARWPLLVAWLALIFGLSSIPNELAPSPRPLPVDKIAHFVEYAILAFLIVAVSRRVARSRQVTPPLLAAGIALAMIYGVTDEWHQRFVPGRDPSFSDFAADAVGALAGGAVAYVLLRPVGGDRRATPGGPASRRRAR